MNTKQQLKFTGMKDYRNKKIYEGDIIKFKNYKDAILSDKERWQVAWDNEIGRWLLWLCGDKRKEIETLTFDKERFSKKGDRGIVIK